MKKTIKYFVTIIALLFSLQVWSQIPEKPNPPRLVNDFSKILSDNELQSLETKLRNYNDSTSTQIVVVIVNDIGNTDVADFTFQIGEKWGVGKKDRNNGAVIVIKPKIGNSKGKAFIGIGYGLEGVITDALSRRIVEQEMIPNFQQGNYFSGIDAATTALIKLASGEFKADKYTKQQGKGSFIMLAIIIAIVLILMRSSGSSNHMGGNGTGSNLPFWTAMFLASQAGRSHGGSWGGFSGGSGGSGGGGFGGFGGGSFGGGGAGGSW